MTWRHIQFKKRPIHISSRSPKPTLRLPMFIAATLINSQMFCKHCYYGHCYCCIASSNVTHTGLWLVRGQSLVVRYYDSVMISLIWSLYLRTNISVVLGSKTMSTSPIHWTIQQTFLLFSVCDRHIEHTVWRLFGTEGQSWSQTVYDWEMGSGRCPAPGTHLLQPAGSAIVPGLSDTQTEAANGHQWKWLLCHWVKHLLVLFTFNSIILKCIWVYYV